MKLNNMRNVALAMLSAALLWGTALPAMAQGALAGVIGASAPIMTTSTSTETATAAAQAVVNYMDRTWSWDRSESKYTGTYPLEIGAELGIFPNALTQSGPILAMGVLDSEAEVTAGFDFDKKSGTWRFRGPGAFTLQRNSARRFELRIALTAAMGVGPHCLRFYALVGDGERHENNWHPIPLIPWRVPIVSKSNKCELVEVFRFKTEVWPAGRPKPSPDYFTNLFGRVGNGGSGDRFRTILDSDERQARTAAAQAAAQSALPASGETVTEEVTTTPPTPNTPPAEPRQEAAQVPQSIDFTIIFVRDKRTSCWEVADATQVRNRAGNVPVFFQYLCTDGNWSDLNSLRADRCGVLHWEDGIVGSSVALRVSFCRDGQWQTRTFNVTPTTHVVVVPVS